jgi:hydroxypyruvate reductase/glycerate 2-kinase
MSKHLDQIIKLIQHEPSIGTLEFASDSSRIWILGAGKASVSMAAELYEDIPHPPFDGIIISPTEDYIDNIQIFRGSHPYPSETNVAASYELLELARSIPPGDTVFFCMSGGASSLLTIPPFGIEIEDLEITFKLLLESGATIQEMNIVRKHLCELKGGKLGAALSHTNLITLVISDVPGNDVSTIGSGPTVGDPSSFTDAKSVLELYNLWDKIPLSIQTHIQLGVEGIIPENPKPNSPNFKNHSVKIINSAEHLAQQVADYLSSEGLDIWVAPEAYSDNVRNVSKEISAKAISVLSKNFPVNKPAALVFYGESYVDVKGSGKGGRNLEMALTVAISLEGQHNVSLISLGTDGIDGPTDAAGAIIDSYTTLKARKKKLSPEEYLVNNDSYHFHEQMETLIKTGPTGNNLMDLQVLIVE